MIPAMPRFAAVPHSRMYEQQAVSQLVTKHRSYWNTLMLLIRQMHGSFNIAELMNVIKSWNDHALLEAVMQGKPNREHIMTTIQRLHSLKHEIMDAFVQVPALINLVLQGIRMPVTDEGNIATIWNFNLLDINFMYTLDLQINLTQLLNDDNSPGLHYLGNALIGFGMNVGGERTDDMLDFYLQAVSQASQKLTSEQQVVSIEHIAHIEHSMDIMWQCAELVHLRNGIGPRYEVN
eukprot:766019-Hanusia_phi.AAC.3